MSDAVVKAAVATTWADKLEHSEALDAVMAAATKMYELNVSFGQFLQIDVIIDTNIVVGDLLTLLKTNGQEHRRPAIFELLAKKTLVGYFPLEKLDEVHAKCVEMSRRYSISLDLLKSLWEKYRQHLYFVRTSDLERERADSLKLASRDPTDVPFVQALHIVGASVVLSNDPDLHASGAPVMPWSRVLVDLRHYSRKHGLQVAIILGTSTAVLVPMAALVGCVKLIDHACKSIPRNALLAAVAGIAIALLIPQSRAFLIKTGKAVLEGLKEFGSVVGPAIGKAFEEAERAKAEAAAMRPALDKALAPMLQTRITLAQACYRACLVAAHPLTVSEVWSVASRNGAKSRAQDPLRSVLTALRRHRLLEVLPDGRWQLAPPAHAASGASLIKTPSEYQAA